MNQQNIDARAFFWALQGLCALHRKPFSIELAQQQCAAPYTNGALITALQSYGLDAKTSKGKSKALQREAFPLMVWLQDEIVDVTPIESPQAADELSAPSAQVPQGQQGQQGQHDQQASSARTTQLKIHLPSALHQH